MQDKQKHNVFLPVSELGSFAIEPSLLMVLITKFFSRVKLVKPTLSELSITNTISRAPHLFSQSEMLFSQSEMNKKVL